jgi:hypothetical protein
MKIDLQTALSLVFALIGLASVVAKMTPTEADNKVVDYILYLLNKLALNPTKDDARK